MPWPAPQISGQAHGRDLGQAAGFDIRIETFNVSLYGRIALRMRQHRRQALRLLEKKHFQGSLRYAHEWKFHQDIPADIVNRADRVRHPGKTHFRTNNSSAPGSATRSMAAASSIRLSS